MFFFSSLFYELKMKECQFTQQEKSGKCSTAHHPDHSTHLHITHKQKNLENKHMTSHLQHNNTILFVACLKHEH